MRISDWSSDVCSSDLAAPVLMMPRRPTIVSNDLSTQMPTRVPGLAPRRLRYSANLLARSFRQPKESASDRKSVVEGKSWSVRVDHGGRRIIKKKKAEK